MVRVGLAAVEWELPEVTRGQGEEGGLGRVEVLY